MEGPSPKKTLATRERVSRDLVEKYYSSMGSEEWKRLFKDAYHRLEFDTTMHYLKKHLPKRGYILDAGGGPGRYTIELANKGYEVSLLDLTKCLLKIAERQAKKLGVRNRIRSIAQGDLSNLDLFKDETFDAVICLGGALSHIVERSKREKAISELARVAKKDSCIFVSVIGRMALLVTELARFPHEIELDIFPKLRDTGDYFGGYGFAPCHFYTVEEVRKAFEEKGLTVLETVGLEGLASGHQRETNKLFKKHPRAWRIWWQTHLQTCTNPASVGISEHFLLICKKA